MDRPAAETLELSQRSTFPAGQCFLHPLLPSSVQQPPGAHNPAEEADNTASLSHVRTCRVVVFFQNDATTSNTHISKHTRPTRPVPPGPHADPVEKADNNASDYCLTKGHAESPPEWPNNQHCHSMYFFLPFLRVGESIFLRLFCCPFFSVLLSQCPPKWYEEFMFLSTNITLA